MNRYYNFILTTAVLICSSLGFYSCSEDLLDINNDPNTSTQLALPSTLAFAQVSLVSNLLDEPNTNAGSFSRMWYTTAIRNYEQNQGTYSNSWVNMYSRPLANLQAVRACPEGDTKRPVSIHSHHACS